MACVGLLLGVGLGELWSIPSASVVITGYFLISLLAVGSFGFRARRWVWPVVWCLGWAVLGNFRLAAAQIIPITDASKFAGQTVTIQGMVADDPQVAIDTTQFTLRVEKVDDQPATGKILVKTTKYPSYQYGNVLQLTGKLVAPEPLEQSGYAKYLARRDIYAACDYPEVTVVNAFAGQPIWRWLYQIKHYFLTVTSQILPEPNAGLLAGLLLGISAVLPKNLMDSFSATGLTHIVALSGFNISIVAGAVVSLLRWLPLSLRLSVAMVVIWLFVLLTGAAPSAVRAGLMGSLILLAGLVGRLADVTVSLCLTAAAMVFLNPKILMSDVGFQLSFLATIGIIYLSPAMDKWFWRLPQLFRGLIAPTLSALIMVTPILAVNFGQISIVAPLTNVLVVPLVPLAMLLGFWAIVGGVVQTDLGLILGWVAWAPLKLIVVITEYFHHFSWASITVNIPSGSWMIIYYLGIASLLIMFYARQKSLALEPLRPAHPR